MVLLKSTAVYLLQLIFSTTISILLRNQVSLSYILVPSHLPKDGAEEEEKGFSKHGWD